MRTTKPISTVSFNTPEYLAQKLRELQRAGRVSFWAFMTHQPEDDEGGKKQHSHLFVEPSKMLQTDDLRAELMEFDPANPDHPRGCISFGSSRFDTWYLYALHDRRFLASKGESRRFQYQHDEFVSSDPDDLLFRAKSINLLALSPYADMMDAIEHGISWTEYFSRGTVPIQQVALCERAWFLLAKSATVRGDHPDHPMDIDPITGEVTEKGGDPS